MAGPARGSQGPDLDTQVERIFDFFLAGPICFDTMIALYFELGGISDRFRGVFKDRSHIPGAVYRELDGHLRGRGAAGTILRKPRFAQVHQITDDAMAERVLDRQRRWRGKAAVEMDPLPDRGEAECLELCLKRGLPLMTHDHNALRDAARDGIVVGSIIDVLAVMVVLGAFSSPQAWLAYSSFVRAGLYPVRGYPANGTGETTFADLIARCRARKRAPAIPPPTS